MAGFRRQQTDAVAEDRPRTHPDQSEEPVHGGDQPARPLSRDVWLTRDGRELTIKEMYRPHLGNAQAILTKWLKVEKDPVKRRELKSWRSRMRRELVKREKAWQAKRKATQPSSA